ncbi:2-C-methyl-D-erythritol 4-phosphate cytidylyltransferase [Fulvivirgaceae bacterium PWU4]|uniref:2-C-methyl-D-erythritol 4-phosphate cytidylyltransferase n=1 Tax=Chryseosolibacter histidini TaxID=2782349 RepID=A0AAP2GQ80_9BACT|nr:2-C-methyl-D-erythritol 4-phosphate cytidylyltransferase [Chryseosolibacter histidini]MBT1698227.1 2-C-methyl-D-erythritol 4-phosphate cytidylyltransferase [Chryseosolibacter histidini]
MNRPEYALIVAGGKGTRMKSKIPKQFIELQGLPVLLHTINAFFRYKSDIAVVLVLPQQDFETWHAIVKKYNFTHPITLQQGGDSRFQSVKKGLEKIAGNGLVAIHDGVRPLVSEAIIAESFRLAAQSRSAVAAVPLKESIRIEEGNSTRALDRSQYRLIQTPQTFEVQLIKKAYEIPEDASLTDDASVAERAGHAITLFEGSYRNIKITTEEDLVIAGAMLQANSRL